MPYVVSDINVLVSLGEAFFDEQKYHYVDTEGNHLVTFQEVAAGRRYGYVDEPLIDYDEPNSPVYIKRDLDY